MKTIGKLVATSALIASLGACNSLGNALGFTRSSPDEFEVLTKAPLVVPPNVNLRPPRPGETTAPELQAVNRSREAVFGRGGPKRKDMTLGENVILSRSGAYDASDDIRTVVKAEEETTATTRKEEGITDRVLFWRSGDDPTLGNPEAE